MTAENTKRTDNRIVLLDAHSLIHRAYHALPTELRTRTGIPTNAVYGFANMLLRLLEDFNPEHMAAAFDSPGPTFRHEEFQDYKANRPEMPEDLRPQIPLVRRLLKALGIPVYALEGYEADDIIGFIAKKASAEGYDVYVVSSDRDLLQLVGGKVKALINLRGMTDLEEYDPAKVKEKLGIAPEQIPDYKALVGDPSDNIPGVPGIGKKTAQKLLSEFQHLEDALAHLEQLPTRARNALQENGEAAKLSRRLAVIDCDVPIEVSLEDCRMGDPDGEQLNNLLRELEFGSLVERMRKRYPVLQQGDEATTVTVEASDSISHVVLADSSSLAEWLGSHDDLRTIDMLIIPRFPQQDAPGPPAWLLLAADKHSNTALIRLAPTPAEQYNQNAKSAGFANPPTADTARRPTATGVTWTQLQQYLKDTLGSPGIRKRCLNGKVDTLCMAGVGLGLKGIEFDVVLAAYLLEPTQSRYTLEQLAMGYCSTYLKPWKEVLEQTECQDLLELSDDDIIPHLCRRFEAFRSLLEVLPNRLREEELESLYNRIEIPLIPILADMELTGIRIDRHKLEELSQNMDEEIQNLTDRIQELAGEEFNLNSPKQLAHILFDKLSLPVVKKTKTGPSTDAEVLEKLADKHPIVQLILAHRAVTKLKSTYVDALLQLADDNDRVHTSFMQTVTATGRLSSVNPNLQNIPVRTDAGRHIRETFIPSYPNWLIMAADYSQIELRILAHLSGDKALIDAFRRGEDIHRRTAAEVLEIPPDEVTEKQRSAAKAINFGIIYGISAYGLARNTGLDQREAQRYIDNYFAKYPGVKRYLDEAVNLARRCGYVRTMFNRKRQLPDIKSRNPARRHFAERTAMNTPIQGTAADIMKLAMIEAYQTLQEGDFQARMLLQVHDELVFEVHKEHLRKLAPAIRKAMQDVVELKVPLLVSISVGPNWGELEELKLGDDG